MFLAILIAVLLLLFCLAFMYSEGLWGNFITWVNLVLSSFVAVNFFEPIADWLDSQENRGTYLWDFVSIWSVFLLTFLILKFSTDAASRTKVRFPKILDTLGSLFFAWLVSFTMYGWVWFTLHAAPLHPNFSSLAIPEVICYGVQAWESRGSFSRFGSGHGLDETKGPDTFYFKRYIDRRAVYKEKDGILGT